jgi:hypothetical protein
VGGSDHGFSFLQLLDELFQRVYLINAPLSSSKLVVCPPTGYNGGFLSQIDDSEWKLGAQKTSWSAKSGSGYFYRFPTRLTSMTRNIFASPLPILLATVLIVGMPQPAQSSGPVASAVAVQGNYAYVGVGRGLVVVDISDVSRPAVIGHVGYHPEEAFWHASLRVEAIAVSGAHAFVLYHHRMHTDKMANMAVFDVSNPKAPAPIGAYHTQKMSPFRVLVSGRYAYLYGNSGLEIVDVSNPGAPKLAGLWQTPAPVNQWTEIPVWAGSPGNFSHQLGLIHFAGSHVAVVRIGLLPGRAIGSQVILLARGIERIESIRGNKGIDLDCLVRLSESSKGLDVVETDHALRNASGRATQSNVPRVSAWLRITNSS